VAATPASAAGIFATYPGTIRVFSGHYLQRRPWTEPLFPTTWKKFRRYVTNTTDERLARDLYSVLVCESGRAYCEMGYWFLDRNRATRVDFAAVTTPVLAIGARRDRLVHRRVDSRIRPPGVSRQRATRHDESHRRVDGRASHPDRRLSIEKAELLVAS
jgi:hypothetical protein